MKLTLFSFLFIFTLNSFGQFSPIHTIDTGLVNGTDLAIGDINGDSQNDIIINIYNLDFVGYYLNLGNGTFSELDTITNLYNEPLSLVLFDSDEDSDLDICFYYSSGIRLFTNDGTGNYTDFGLLPGSVQQATYFKPFDLDADGDEDLVGGTTSNDVIVWYKNNGGNSFTEIAISNLETDPKYVDAGDLDNDGDMDLAVTYSFNTSKIGWLENLGNNIYGPVNILASFGTISSDIQIRDLNNDGLKDIIFFSPGDDRIAWFENTGAGNFLPYQNITTDLDFILGMDTGDFDSDGDIDVVGAEQWYEISWFENDGTGVFSGPNLLSDQVELVRKIKFSNIIGNSKSEMVGICHNSLFYFGNYFSLFKAKGKVYFDENQNNLFDALDVPFPNFFVSADSIALGLSNSNGDYIIGVDSGQFSIQPKVPYNWSLIGDSLSYLRTLNSQSPEVDSLDFSLFPDSLFLQPHIELIKGLPRCSTPSTSWILIQNRGTVAMNTTLDFYLDTAINFLSSDPMPDSINGNYFRWDFDSINVFQSKEIQLSLRMPGVASIGMDLTDIYSVSTENLAGDLNYAISDTNTYKLICAYDPNEKIVDPVGVGLAGFIQSDEWLEYTIYFQNTGNDTAFNIVLIDTMDINLEIESMEILASSHNMGLSYQDGYCKFIFDDIHLPDSNVNEIESHGFVRYRIKPINGTTSFTEINNTAYIYFDYNPPIVTNTVLNTICEDFPSIPVCLNIFDDLSICIGNTVNLLANGNGSINWYNPQGILLNSGDNYNITLNEDATFILKDSTCYEGMDSLIIHVIVDTNFFGGVNLMNDTLSAIDTNELFYQWINCSNGLPIADATEFFYAPDTGGDYALIMGNSFCVDTSDCFTVTFLDVVNSKTIQQISEIWPNPFNRYLNLDLPTDSEIHISDYSGKICFNEKLYNGKHHLDLGFLENGIYLIKLSNDFQEELFKIVKLD